MANLKAKFKKWLSVKTEHCKSVAPLFSDAFDRKLSPIEKLRVRLHLYTCGACLNYVSNLKFMHEAFSKQEENLGNGKIQASLSPEAKERIKQTLKTQNS
ncbi:MAG: zf-HC2 domain-containing protein [Actinomycetota bacterium]